MSTATYDAAAVDGRIVQIATLNGPKVTVNIAKVMVKRLTHTGSTLRPRTNADKAAMVAAIEAKVMPLLREGRVKPLMDSSFPLGKGRRRAPADGDQRTYWQNCVGGLIKRKWSKGGNPLICFAFMSFIADTPDLFAGPEESLIAEY